MTFNPFKIVNVKYCRGDNIIKMGRLAISNRKILFEYDDEFLKTKLELSPFKLPLRSGIIACEDNVFEGLFGIFNDSLPDGWGRLLLDRKLTKVGINPITITPLDRLCYTGSNGMGALMYEPEISDFKVHQNLKDLDIIADECVHFLDNDDDKYIDDLLLMNGSSAGARPKILVSISSDEKLEVTKHDPKTSHDNWIIKFRSSSDPKDIGCIEYAYHLMAQASGLDVPEARLFKSKKCDGYFGVKRFDRQKSECKHMHSIAGLLHADHRIPTLDYEILLKATLHLTKDIQECEKQFRQMVFNIFSHNRDDHSKNFSFLMDKDGKWKVSPAYDLTFSSGPVGQHSTTILGEGKNPSISHMLKIAEIVSIKPKTALTIIDEVKAVVSKWDKFADKSKVSSKSSKNIAVTLSQILNTK
jgi:serine/threonine-protein kinase HipA